MIEIKTNSFSIKTNFKLIIALVLVVTLLLPLNAGIPGVLASPEHRIVLPFHTSWENQQALGRVNSIDHSKDFCGYFGPSDPLPPELGMRNNEVSPPSFAGDISFGSRQLMAAGYFDSTDSYCYFNLFDMTPDTDVQPPIKIRPYTFINVWYYHHTKAHCMIDGQLYNRRTGQYKSLSTFCHVVHYDSIHVYKYIKDQNGVRIHPGYRCDDPVGSWQWATFDLSIVWENDPDDWYITEIWVGFDNTIDPTHPTGQVRTYFDMLYITYGTGNRQYTACYDETQFYESTLTASITTWWWSGPDPTTGKYDLNLKLAISAYTEGYVKHFETGDPHFFIRPYQLRVKTYHSGAQYRVYPEPMGLNLTDPLPPLTGMEAFLLDCFWIVVIEGCGVGGALVEFVGALYRLGTYDAGAVTFEWPYAVGWWTEDLPYYVLPHLIQGEVYLQIQGLPPGSHTIPITFEVDNCYADSWPMWGIVPIQWSTESFTLNIDWKTTPDDLYTLNMQADTGGYTDPLPGSYGYNEVTDVEIEAFPYSQYAFDYWTKDGDYYSSDSPTTITVDYDYTLKAWFHYVGGGGGGGGCVAEGTLVTMADGSTKPIEEIEKGDKVLGFDPTTGSSMTENVLGLTKTKMEVMVVINNGMLKLTPTDQPIFIRNATYEGWVRDPATLQVGWKIYNATGSSWVPITSISIEDEKTQVYDMVLDGYTTYLANSILLMDKGHKK